MEKTLERLRIAKAESPRTQIRHHVRSLIVGGDLAPGATLPTTQVLAKAWKTHVATVHLALTDLVHEGLLVRRKGHGTFVAERITALRDIGIYCEAEILLAPWHWFDRSVIAALCEIMKARGYEAHIWADSRDQRDRHKVWEEMERAVESRTVQGFIRMMIDSDAVRWMNRLPVPSASIGSYDPVQKVKAVVDVDIAQLAKSSVESLAAQGCRSVGYISAISRAGDLGKVFHRQFVKSARQAGLRVEEAWMRERGPARGGYAYLDYGYDEFLKVVEMADHPDGLLIWHDIVAEGALTAVATRRIRVPDEMKLVLHRNEGHRYNCPVPVTYAVTREKEIALALVEHLEKQLAGESCVPASIPFHLVPSAELDAAPHHRP